MEGDTTFFKESRFSLLLPVMINLSSVEQQIQYVTNFQDFLSTPFHGNSNAICWTRKLMGGFSEIVNQVSLNENMAELHLDELLELQLTGQGQLAREILLDDLKVLKAHGASPTLNVIQSYERDDSYPFFPTDVYSFHVDRAPIPVDTFLCTYYGETSEILPNSQAEQKVLVPEIREELKKLHDGAAGYFESFLSEQFFDLHYLAKANAQPISLGLGHLCRLATDHPNSKVPPCIHRAPQEKNGQKRLLLIC
ncbi:hypothetical protein CA2015_1495 [Cyclobacterium amurskyense]|uniref:DUF1826 domain-containing protein n=2 Tax=Cyclobacterium amurskyense TaxID=320787 RepID=A0A0H4PDM8_9BACT|nr:hypothetical protein CA2015_1495 [Cyclobacterium amurskyense]